MEIYINNKPSSFYGGVITDFSIGLPEPKTKYIEVPARDGVLDVTVLTAYGKPAFGQRDISIEWAFVGSDPQIVYSQARKVIEDLHGTTLPFSLSFPPDPDYIYTGESCLIKQEWEDRHKLDLTLKISARPYKTRKFPVTELFTIATDTTSEPEQFRLANESSKPVNPFVETGEHGVTLKTIYPQNVYELPPFTFSQLGYVIGPKGNMGFELTGPKDAFVRMTYNVEAI